jgi:hypothetical protein
MRSTTSSCGIDSRTAAFPRAEVALPRENFALRRGDLYCDINVQM